MARWQKKLMWASNLKQHGLNKARSPQMTMDEIRGYQPACGPTDVGYVMQARSNFK